MTLKVIREKLPVFVMDERPDGYTPMGRRIRQYLDEKGVDYKIRGGRTGEHPNIYGVMEFPNIKMFHLVILPGLEDIVWNSDYLLHWAKKAPNTFDILVKLKETVRLGLER